MAAEWLYWQEHVWTWVWSLSSSHYHRRTETARSDGPRLPAVALLPELTTGPFLGKLKKELDDEDAIVEFATAGPKNYGFRTHLGTLECKVHGFRLNIRSQQQLNFNLLKQNVLEEIQRPQEQPVNSLLVNLISRLL